MTATILSETFRESLLTIVEEIFDAGPGFVIDPGTSLLATLATITAEEASHPVGPGRPTLAAQVNHLQFSLNLLQQRAAGGDTDPDWTSSWQVSSVTDAEWNSAIARPRDAYRATRTFVQQFSGWDAAYLGGALAMLAHCAYHLGEIRQGLGVLRAMSNPQALSR
jgi:hypothetical protein